MVIVLKYCEWKHLRGDGLQNSSNDFELDPATLNYDLLTWPLIFVTLNLTLVILTLDHLSETKLKTGIFIFLTRGILTFDLWDMMVLNSCTKF